ncbi:MAG: hypothetical protein V1933_07800 [Candidatus Omnitrophota bacterium]
MEYTKKHKNLLAKLFKKAGMMKEAKTILFSDGYDCEIALAMRDAAGKADVPIGATPALLDAARRYETRDCAIFKECTLPHCEGGVWCDIHNLGGSHGRIGDALCHLGESAFDVPLKKRRKLMLEMLEYKTRRKPAQRAKKVSSG